MVTSLENKSQVGGVRHCAGWATRPWERPGALPVEDVMFAPREEQHRRHVSMNRSCRIRIIHPIVLFCMKAN